MATAPQRSSRGIQKPVDSDQHGPAWPKAKREGYLEIGTPLAVCVEDNSKCEFWDTVKLPSPHL